MGLGLPTAWIRLAWSCSLDLIGLQPGLSEVHHLLERGRNKAMDLPYIGDGPALYRRWTCLI
jgi:hypothetical protein